MGLAGGAPPVLLMRALRRLRTDVALIERALLEEGDGVDRTAEAKAVGGWFDAAAAAVRDGGAVPAPVAVGAAGETGSEFGPFAFTLAALRRDQAAFQARVAELG